MVTRQARPEHDAASVDSIADGIVAAGAIIVQVMTDALAQLAPDLNITDLRVLTILAQRGPTRLIDVAAALDVTPTTATRVADRLAGSAMVQRVRSTDDRREIFLDLAAPGAVLVDAVFARRRAVVSERLEPLSLHDRRAAARALEAVMGAAVPDESEKSA